MYNWDDPINEALNKPEEVKAPPVIREQPKESSKMKSEITTDVNQGYTGIEDLEKGQERFEDRLDEHHGCQQERHHFATN